MTSYPEFFQRINSYPPYEWQVEFGREEDCANRLVSISTGLGKTRAVISAWLFHRVFQKREDWPRRLVFCLPMRVLVEQTHYVVQEMLQRLKVAYPDLELPDIAILMGGEDAGDWRLFPETDAIFIGTQDMLLSRAMNRGYASPRARWPMEFGLINFDALWVLDEVQLMDNGLLTSSQLQAFFEMEQTRDRRAEGARPRRSWWMSATLDKSWFDKGDFLRFRPKHVFQTHILPASLEAVRKAVEIREILQSSDDKMTEWADAIAQAHEDMQPNPETGRLTLVVVNTVDGAVGLFQNLRKHTGNLSDKPEIRLVHSRFRPMERDRWRDDFLNREVRNAQTNRIIVATQVVEAGVDLDADLLITELAPFASMVQRFGRCARMGGCGTVIVVDRRLDEKKCAPYSREDLDVSRAALDDISQSDTPDVSVVTLARFLSDWKRNDTSRYAALMRYDPIHLLTRREFGELFDTGPDLTGADIDISRYIRSGEERDVLVFWRDFQGKPGDDFWPNREELCPVPLNKAKVWLKKEELRKKSWIRDFVNDEWGECDVNRLYPGVTVLVHASCGGYDPEIGWTGAKPKKKDKPIRVVDSEFGTGDEIGFERDDRSKDAWKTIATHGREVADEMTGLAHAVGLSDALGEVLKLVARVHDYGKSHEIFQEAISQRTEQVDRQDIAKAPADAWKRGYERPGFRHEFASMLALLELLRQSQPLHAALLGNSLEILEALGVEPESATGDPDNSLGRRLSELSARDFNLLAYLVVAHHGKARIGIHATPHDQKRALQDTDGNVQMPVLGVMDGDEMPAVDFGDGLRAVPVRLALEPVTLGFSKRFGPSWTERTIHLVEEFGIYFLGYLETLLRCADIRASRLSTSDPLLEGGSK